MSEKLTPMVDMIGDYPVRHGERGVELDPENQHACLCGEPDYMLCPNFAYGVLGARLSWVGGELRVFEASDGTS